MPLDFQLTWYTIRRVLGQGGYGITYLAYDNNLERDVAIKEYMPREIASRNADLTIQPLDHSDTDSLQSGLQRFIQEARTLSKFDHANIVRVHSVFEENNTAYMIMSYEQGKSLAEVLKQGQPGEDCLMDIVMPLLDGLEVMHRQGFIHRDIKPANIFIRDDGSPVLLDFGSARQAMGEETKTLTNFVTPGYAPFEQYYGKSDMQGPWTDIYGLGATLFRAITGNPPVDSTFRSRVSGEKAIDEIWDELDKYHASYSTFFLRAIEHALRSNHRDRPQSAQEWRNMLSDPNVSTQTQWRLAKSVSRNIPVLASASSNRRWVIWVIVILLIILPGLVTGFILLQT